MKYASTSFGCFIVAAMLAAGTIPAHAQPAPTAGQSEEDHSVHHPENAQTVAPVQTPAPSPSVPPGGMMGSGMMGMMPMMRGDGMMEMMSMMHGGMMGGMPFEHVEGRLAFLKTELKITSAQEPQWNNFADAIRSVAQSMKPMHEQMMQGMMQGTESAAARLDRYERMLSGRLKVVRTIKTAFEPLYAALSDEQKTVADKLLASPMGIF